jgi:hypothetical protein
MAPSTRGLVYVLTFWVVAWASASIRTRSLDSGWWGTQEALALRQAARAPTLTGEFAEAERILLFGAAATLTAVPFLETLEMGRAETGAQAAQWFAFNKGENFPSADSLIHFHHRLRDLQMLLVFGWGCEGILSLGDPEHFACLSVTAVDRTDLRRGSGIPAGHSAVGTLQVHESVVVIAGRSDLGRYAQ